ncbi:MAG: hypothetical protein ACOX7I_02790 [Oscillospiraceae bacterium]
MRVKNALVGENIPIKEKIRSARGRMGSSLTMRGSPFALNSAGLSSQSQQYVIYTKKERVHEASTLISRLNNT